MSEHQPSKPIHWAMLGDLFGANVLIDAAFYNHLNPYIRIGAGVVGSLFAIDMVRRVTNPQSCEHNTPDYTEDVSD